jgi:hypothetical protein
MKKAIVEAVTVFVLCPYCRTEVEERQSGSLLWEVGGVLGGGRVRCENCRKWFSFPSRVTVELRRE